MKIHFIWSDENYAWTIRKKMFFRVVEIIRWWPNKGWLSWQECCANCVASVQCCQLFPFSFFFQKKAKRDLWAELKMSLLILVLFQTLNFHEKFKVGNTGGIIILTLKICDHTSRSAWLLSTVGALCNRL